MVTLHRDGAAVPGLAVADTAEHRAARPSSGARAARPTVDRRRVRKDIAPGVAAVRAVADPLDLVLSRLERYRLRKSGLNRWRAVCPVCGERNPSTLSIGVGDTENVLLKCHKLGCDPEQITGALGLELSDLFPARGEPGSGASPLKRRRLLSAQQALDLLDKESFFVLVAGENLAAGMVLTDADRARLAKAAKRIAGLRDEVMA